MKLQGKLAAGALALMAALGLPSGAGARHHVSEGRTVVSTERHEVAAHEAGKTHIEQRQQAPQDSTPPYSRDFGVPKPWEVEQRDEGGTLLFSDSPEYVTEDGILYQDVVEGDARILYYHLNNMSSPRKVAVVLEDAAGSKLTVVRITRGGTAAPSTDYLKVGKATQMAYFGKQKEDTVLLVNGRKRLLQDSMNKVLLQPGELVYGVYDFHADHPVRVSVIMYPAFRNPYAFLEQAKVLPKDEVMLRGTFKGMNRVIYSRKAYDASKDGIVYVDLGDDNHDKYKEGIDATDGSKALNYGNYGILYKLALPTQGPAATQYYLSPLGGVYAGAMSVRRDHSISTRLLETPAGCPFFGDGSQSLSTSWSDRVELADLGSYDNSVPTFFEFSPPGASNLPVQLIMMPAGN